MSEHAIDILLRARDLASKQIAGVNKELGKVGGISAHANKGLRSVGSNLKSAFTTPLGLLGIGGGLFALDKVFEDSIGKAQEFGAEISKMQAITGLDAQTTSALAAAMEHYGIASDDALKITGMLEKNIGNLTGTATNNASSLLKVTKAQQAVTLARMRLNELEHKGKASASSLTAARFRLADAETALKLAQDKSKAGASGAAKFYDKYRFSLTNANGTVKNANQLLLTSADYFNNKSIPAQTKAAAMAKLYGRSWQTLIPFLKAGSKGIGEAEAEAKRLGLTLSGDNIEALKKNREATREWNTALGGLELQIGLKLIPYMTTLAQTATQFVSQHGSDITSFFDDAAKFSGEFGGAIHDYVIPAFNAISGVWGKIPTDLKKLLIAGFAVNKLSGGALTGIVGELGKGAAGIVSGALKGALGINTPLVNIKAGVVNGAGGGLPGAGGAAGAAEGGLAAIGLTAATMTGLTVGIGAAVAAAIVTDHAINDKGGLGPAMKPITDKGLTLGPNVIIKDPTFTGTRFTGGKGGGLIIQGNNPTREHLGPPTPIHDSERERGTQLFDPIVKAQNRARASFEGSLRAVGTGVDGVKETTRSGLSEATSATRTGLSNATSATLSGTSGTTGAVNVGASRTVAAINGAFSRMPTPIVTVNVTAASVTKSVTLQSRNGTVGGSRSGAGGSAHNKYG